MSHHAQPQPMSRPWPGGGPPSPEIHHQHHQHQQSHQTQHQQIPHPQRTLRSRPPLERRGYSAAAATGQSRFVEGSMNDRVSAAPPPGFLGHDQLELQSPSRGGSGSWGGEGWEGADGGRGFGKGYMNTGGNGGVGGGIGAGVGVGAGGGRYALRRPRSTVAALPAQQQRVTKKGSFWDGVREKLHLRGSKSSGSITGRVVGAVVGGGNGGRGENGLQGQNGYQREQKGGEQQQQQQQQKGAEVGAGGGQQKDTTGYPSREEVLESYRNLVASGFFDAHAIRGGRHPGPPGMVPGKVGEVSLPGGKSFADHMAAQQRQQQQQHVKLALSIPPFPQSHQQAPTPTASASTNPMRPPPLPLPPRTSSQTHTQTHGTNPKKNINQLRLLTSPQKLQRGTKRGASLELAPGGANGDASETATRKLVKKLRHSASRLSVEIGGMGRDRDREREGNYVLSSGAGKPRPSTSSYASSLPRSPMSPTFTIGGRSSMSIMEGVTGEFEADEQGEGEGAIGARQQQQQHQARLVKPKGGRRRIIGLGRRYREPTPTVTSAPASIPVEVEDADVMMIDQPDPEPHQQQPQQHHGQGSVRQVRNITPPPASFLTHTHTGQSFTQRMRLANANIMTGVQHHSPYHAHQHEPLSVVPDPNQGIPFVPRIPSEFTRPAVVETAVTATVETAAPAVVVVMGGSSQQSEDGKGEEGGKVMKNGNRDSGLGGEDVENKVPVWE